MTYFWVLTATLIVPLFFSFEKNLQFWKRVPALLLACTLVGLVFLLWDIAFTRYEVWGFGSSHIMGLKFFGLPVEEVAPWAHAIPYELVCGVMNREQSEIVE